MRRSMFGEWQWTNSQTLLDGNFNVFVNVLHNQHLNYSLCVAQLQCLQILSFSQVFPFGPLLLLLLRSKVGFRQLSKVPAEGGWGNSLIYISRHFFTTTRWSVSEILPIPIHLHVLRTVGGCFHFVRIDFGTCLQIAQIIEIRDRPGLLKSKPLNLFYPLSLTIVCWTSGNVHKSHLSKKKSLLPDSYRSILILPISAESWSGPSNLSLLSTTVEPILFQTSSSSTEPVSCWTRPSAINCKKPTRNYHLDIRKASDFEKQYRRTFLTRAYVSW